MINGQTINAEIRIAVFFLFKPGAVFNSGYAYFHKIKYKFWLTEKQNMHPSC